jgi:hypothetical protein
MDWRGLEQLVEAHYTGEISRRDFARGALAVGVAAAALPSAMNEILARRAGAQPLKGSGEGRRVHLGRQLHGEPEEAVLRPVRAETGIRVRVVGRPTSPRSRRWSRTRRWSGTWWTRRAR